METLIYQIPRARALSGPGGAGAFGPQRLTLVRLPYPGLDGVLADARQLVGEALRDPAVQAAARQIGRRQGAHATAQAVYDWVKRHVRYVLDDRGTERLQPASVTIQRGAGDCEDHVVLASSLLELLGVDAQFFVVRQHHTEEFNHILLRYRANGDWHGFDTTVDSRAGAPIDWQSFAEIKTVDLNDMSCCANGLGRARQAAAAVVTGTLNPWWDPAPAVLSGLGQTTAYDGRPIFRVVVDDTFEEFARPEMILVLHREGDVIFARMPPGAEEVWAGTDGVVSVEQYAPAPPQSISNEDILAYLQDGGGAQAAGLSTSTKVLAGAAAVGGLVWLIRNS